MVVVGGDAGMTGAVRMAARAAFAAGAGLVHAVAPPTRSPRWCRPSPTSRPSRTPSIERPTAALLELVARADAVVIGPGLGRAPGRRAARRGAGRGARRAVVLDADALVAFQGAVAELRRARRRRAAGAHAASRASSARSFPALAPQRELDPWARRGGGGRGDRRGGPAQGRADGRRAAGPAAAHGRRRAIPGLATGGSGDVLSGLVGTALAQGLEPEIAAALGAQALGRAADLAARRVSARSLRPMDVVAALPDLWREWEVLRRAPPAAASADPARAARPQTL